jgi:predicted nuclease of predicted toxin-antitoxin system
MLQNVGHEVLRLREYLATDSNDTDIISRAQELDSILLSLNGDFADIVNYPPDRYQGIIALRVDNHPEILQELLMTLTAYLSKYGDMSHYAGKLLIAEVHRIRMR